MKDIFPLAIAQLVLAPLALMLGVWLLAPSTANTYLKALGATLLLLIAQGVAAALVLVHPLVGLAFILVAPFVITRWLYGMSFFRTLVLQIFLGGLVFVLNGLIDRVAGGRAQPPGAEPPPATSLAKPAPEPAGSRALPEALPPGGGLRAKEGSEGSDTVELRVAGHQVTFSKPRMGIEATGAPEQAAGRWTSVYTCRYDSEFKGTLSFSKRSAGGSLEKLAGLRREAFLRAHPDLKDSGPPEPSIQGGFRAIGYRFEGTGGGTSVYGRLVVVDARSIVAEASSKGHESPRDGDRFSGALMYFLVDGRLGPLEQGPPQFEPTRSPRE